MVPITWEADRDPGVGGGISEQMNHSQAPE